MSKQSVRASINAQIKENGTGAITGNILNSVLNAIVDDYQENGFLHGYDNNQFSMIGWYYSAANGMILKDAAYNGTPLLPLITKSILIRAFFNGTASNAAHGVAFFDEERNFISSIKQTAGWQTLELNSGNIPASAAFFAISSAVSTQDANSPFVDYGEQLNDVFFSRLIQKSLIDDVTGTKINGSYVKDDGSFASNAQYERTDKIYVSPGDVVLITGGVNAGGSVHNLVVFGSSDNVVGVYEQDNAQDAVYVVPNNASYLIANGLVSSAASYRNELSVKVIHSISNIIKTIPIVREEIVSKSSILSSNNIDTYRAGSYISSTGISNLAQYDTYWMFVQKTGTIFVKSPGGSASFFRVGVGTGSLITSPNWSNYASNLAGCPTEENPWTIHAGDILAVSVLAGITNFEIQLDYNENVKKIDGLETDGELENERQIAELKSSVSEIGNKIKIVYVSATKFKVFVPQINTGKYLVHVFDLIHFEDTLSYGGGQTTTLVTEDMWNASTIQDENGNDVIQGNLNFIYYLNSNISGFENENGLVGVGHGCEVKLYQRFFADGVEFNPATNFGTIYCSVMRVTLQSKTYAIDTTTPGFDPSHALPKLTSDGEPIIRTFHSYDAEYHINNHIIWNNRLKINTDGLQFYEGYGAMCQMWYPYVNNITLGTDCQDSNDFVYENGDFTMTPLGVSKNLKTNAWNQAEVVILGGAKHIIKQRMMNVGERIGDPCYTSNSFYNPSDIRNVRVKVYQQPIRGTRLFPGDPETFNTGDVICVHNERRIEFVDSL